MTRSIGKRLRARQALSIMIAASICLLAVSGLSSTPSIRVSAQDKVDGTQEARPLGTLAIPPGQTYQKTNLISNVPGLAPIQDPQLRKPWGLVYRADLGPVIVNNRTNTVGTAKFGPSGIKFPLEFEYYLGNSPVSGPPTGIVANPNGYFPTILGFTLSSSPFLVATIDGGIAAPGTRGPATWVVRRGHRWTGLAIGSNSDGNRLYAADFGLNHIDVFNDRYEETNTSGGFIDPSIPADYHVYNIQNVDGFLYVTYAKYDPITQDVVNGEGLGYVRKFDQYGVKVGSFQINNGPLDAPWGLTIAPSSFGLFHDALLVGNFSANGVINAFNPSSGAFLGTLRSESGDPIVIERLRALQFGIGISDPNALYFTAAINNEDGLFGKLTPTTSQATSLIQFASADFSVSEGGDYIDVTVTRAGDTSAAAKVNYNTVDLTSSGSASQRSDYEMAAGTITFNPGEASKTFRVLIVDDALVEGDEKLSLTLSNPTGAGVGLGALSQATLTIKDNDSSASATNPIDDPSFFIKQQYSDFLGRQPDTIGFNNWLTTLQNCPGGGFGLQNPSCDRVKIALSTFQSEEFQTRGYWVHRFYVVALWRGPKYAEFISDMEQVGGPKSPQDTELAKQQYIDAFVQRPEFTKWAGITDPTAYIDGLMQRAGISNPTLRSQLISQMQSGASRAQALRQLVESKDVEDKFYNNGLVSRMYFGFVRRDPDITGFNNYLYKISAGGDWTAKVRQMVFDFIYSTEYRGRFGKP